MDISLRTAQETLAHFKEQIIRHETENARLLTELADYKQKLESTTSSHQAEIKTCRKKTHEYKSKVRYANEKIRELGDRLISLEHHKFGILQESEEKLSAIAAERDEYKIRAIG
jgi:phage shock protein A